MVSIYKNVEDIDSKSILKKRSLCDLIQKPYRKYDSFY
jgi:hypothetical protein